MTIKFTLIHNGEPVAHARELINVKDWAHAKAVAKYCKNMFEREYKSVDECEPAMASKGKGIEMKELRRFTFELV